MKNFHINTEPRIRQSNLNIKGWLEIKSKVAFNDNVSYTSFHIDEVKVFSDLIFLNIPTPNFLCLEGDVNYIFYSIKFKQLLDYIENQLKINEDNAPFVRRINSYVPSVLIIEKATTLSFQEIELFKGLYL